MATRTIRLIGTAYSTSGNVSLTVNFGGSQVFSGNVATTNSAAPVQPVDGDSNGVANWTVDTSVSGNQTLSIAVSGGTFHFCDLIGNYTGANVDRTGPTDVTITAPADWYDDLNQNTATFDGKGNVTITPADGDAPVIDRSGLHETQGERIGEWYYTVPDGSTLACDFYIDSNRLVLS